MFTLYSTPDCPNCVAAKKLLESRHQTYEVVDVLENEEARERMIEWRVRTVPQIVHNNVHIGGFNDLVKYLGDSDEG